MQLKEITERLLFRLLSLEEPKSSRVGAKILVVLIGIYFYPQVTRR